MAKYKGQELWRHPFGTPLADEAYVQEGKLLSSWFGDLDGDGRRKPLFAAVPVNRGEVGTQVLCFAANGKIQCQFTPGRPVTRWQRRPLRPALLHQGLQVILGKTPSDTRIAVSSNHYLEFVSIQRITIAA